MDKLTLTAKYKRGSQQFFLDSFLSLFYAVIYLYCNTKPNLIWVPKSYIKMSMASGTMNHYIQFVERVFRTGQGSTLAKLLSLRDEHVANRNLRSSDIASLVEGNCVQPLDEIIIYHLSCVKVCLHRIYWSFEDNTPY